jgi:hypothetical protein
MKRIAHSIEMLNEIKLTEDNQEYKEVLVKDELGDILEVFMVDPLLKTQEEFFETTGVRLGLSAWID